MAGLGRQYAFGTLARDGSIAPEGIQSRARRRDEARQIMEKIGYGPDNRLAVTVAARNVPPGEIPP